jgi:hypothetical protein
MKNKIEFSYEVSGKEWLRLKQPCVYVWFRYDACLYVGQSEDGVQRLFHSDHHVINKKSHVSPADTFKVLFVDKQDLLKIEIMLIHSLKPEFNHANSTTQSPSSYLRQEDKEYKGGLEQTLNDLSTKVFGNERLNDLTKVTEDELAIFIADTRKMVLVLNKLKG